jgi:SAM-dependent methyltransferase
MPYLPPALKRLLKQAATAGPTPSPAPGHYEAVYETHARAVRDDAAVGDGDFDLIGRQELAVLVLEGLQRTQTLVDFGCGNGRLAVHAIPWLVGGRYIGIDISETMIERARQRVAVAVPTPPCEVVWIKHAAASFPLGPNTADVICAFSVFTHMEHEDSFRYLRDARRIVRPEGRFLFSCLPMDLPASAKVFLASASEDLHTRWRSVRNVTTSRDLMDAIARLAGWRILRWHPGDHPAIPLLGTGGKRAFGQSVCVLDRPADTP